MNNGEHRIDVVFRNGLKDLEVLPPPEVWDGIQPAIAVQQKPFIWLRVAATVIILFSVGFLAYYLLNDQIYSEGYYNNIAFNVAASQPLREPAPVLPASDYVSDFDLVSQESALLPVTETQPSGNYVLKFNPKTTVSSLPDNNVLMVRNNRSVQIPYQPSLNASLKIAPEIYQPETLAESDIAGPKQKKWSIAALASPTYYSRFSTSNDAVSKQIMASEQPLVSYSGGLSFTYKISRRFSLQSGLYYSSLGQQVDGVNSFAGFQMYDNTKGDRNFEVLTSSGTIFTNNSDIFLKSTGSVNKVITPYTKDVFDPQKASLQYLSNTLEQNLSYLELPLFVRYKLIDRTLDFNLIGGMSYNMLIKNNVFTYIDGSKYLLGKTDGVNPMMFSSSIGMGMEYNFSTKLSLNLEPTFRYYINPFSQTAGTGIHPYSFGIFSGLSYKF
jgi:hypothetical protein